MISYILLGIAAVAVLGAGILGVCAVISGNGPDDSDGAGA